MQSSLIRAYNPYANAQNYEQQIADRSSANKLQKTDKVESKNGINKTKPTEATNSFSAINTEKLISHNEREYFKELFPESKDIIDNHVLFTRSGKAQTVQVAKGIILDNRI
jgi:predicted DsbA family dithiol-disulfide isomerase